MDETDVYKRQEEGDRPMERSPRGRYIRFDVRLGTGAYKSVYKAYDTDQGIDVAWNAIDIGVLPNTEKTRIIQEVQLLQKLEHKNIINFYGSWFSKEKNQVVFITEIMTSGTLKSYIKRVQFIKWKIIKRWCVQILEGLHYLHSQNPPVIHRDLKCDNIFINGNTGDLRIGDLGLSTQLAVHKRSKAQSVLGTPEFMAPELYDESYDEKVDIYAFGMCVLEMVTKEVPYSECINPAQIYKKVTAGIRPKGLQRVVSQAARDFIELCLSRGNGTIDVSAEYLLTHPFLKPSDDDGEMVQVLDEDELEREVKEQQERLARVNEETFAVQLDMESASKSSGSSGAVTDRRKQFPTLSLEPEELSSDSNGTEKKAESSSSTATDVTIQSEEKSAGKRQMVSLSQMKDALAGTDSNTAASTPVPTPAGSPTQPSVDAAAPPGSDSDPIISEVVNADEPLSGRKDVDEKNVDQFLATMPGSEIRIQNTRMKLMGGRDHLLELEDETPEVAQEGKAATRSDGGSSSTALSADEVPTPPATAASDATAQPAKESIESSTAAMAPPVEPLTTSTVPEPQVLPSVPGINEEAKGGVPDIAVDLQARRRPSVTSVTEELPVSMSVPTDPRPEGAALSTASRPPSAASSTSSITSASRRRTKRHEIKAAKDPENEHSLLLNLRIMIDGKSKEIKFPFNLFTDNTHEVACELAVDVGILEPDLEDIADSIRFLVTEGKINNLHDEQVDVWEEAPEPHSFSSKVLPPVAKMSVVQATNTTVNSLPPPPPPPQQAAAAQQTPTSTPLGHLLPGPPIDRPPSAPIFALADQAHSMLASPQTVMNVPPHGASTELPRPEPSLLVLDPGSAASSSTSTASYPLNDGTRSPPHGPLSHAASESVLSTEALLSKLELRERGVSIGSLKDPHFIQKVHNFEDRMKVARSAFDERESTLEAAIRSEEEKHQREIERFRKKMEEFNKQRAAIARQQNGGSGGVPGDLPVDVVVAADGTMNLPSLSSAVEGNHVSSSGDVSPAPSVSPPASSQVVANGSGHASDSEATPAPADVKASGAESAPSDAPVPPSDAPR